MDSGAFKRGWGGHGIPLSEIDNDPTPPYDASGPPPDQKQFAPALHCAHVSKDGLVYVCERGSDRIQVFTKQGKFVNSFFVHPSTQARGANCGGIWGLKDPPCGTVYSLAFSHDPGQKYLLVADGTNNMVWILNRKDGMVAVRLAVMDGMQDNCIGSTRWRSIPRATSIAARWKTARGSRSLSWPTD